MPFISGRNKKIPLFTDHSSPPLSMRDTFKPPTDLWNLRQNQILHTLCFHQCIHTLDSFSVAYSNCQHRCSGPLGSLLSEMMVLGHRHCSTETANQVTQTADYLAGSNTEHPGETGNSDFIMLLRMMCN